MLIQETYCNIYRMGIGDVNSSIGPQWKNKVTDLESDVKTETKDFSQELKGKVKMNVKISIG